VPRIPFSRIVPVNERTWQQDKNMNAACLSAVRHCHPQVLLSGVQVVMLHMQRTIRLAQIRADATDFSIRNA
jgi:hypothetical protein